MPIAGILTGTRRRRTGRLLPAFAPAPGPTPPPPPFKPALFSYLSSQSSLTSLLASDAAGLPAISARHPAESDPYPCLVYRVTRNPQEQLSGDAGFVDADVEIEMWSESPDDIDAIALAITALFHGKSNWSMGGVPVMTSDVEADSDDYETAGDGSDEGPFSETVDVFIRYRT